MREVETERATLADLEGKLAAAEARFIELENDRRRLSYDAVIDGGLTAELRRKSWTSSPRKARPH